MIRCERIHLTTLKLVFLQVTATSCDLDGCNILKGLICSLKGKIDKIFLNKVIISKRNKPRTTEKAIFGKKNNVTFNKGFSDSCL